MEHNPDQTKAESFAEKMLGVLNDGALALMISLGHRTGLFDTMAKLPLSTSQQIASAAGLNERYVREWLGAMVTGGIVDYDQTRSAYHLPQEHAAFLTRVASPDNIAVFAQYIPVLGIVEDEIVECFKNGGGVPYSSYPRFHQVMAEDSGQTVVAALTDSILPLMPGLIESLQKGIKVLDIGCGSGRAINTMAKAFPLSEFFGYDISEEAINSGSMNAQESGLSNAHFEVKDVANLEETGEFDLITAFDAIHDQAKPAQVLNSIYKALSPTGTFLMQDIKASSELHKNLDHPVAPFLYTISCMHCMTVSLSQNGEGLGAMWGEEKAREMLREAGFTGVTVKQLPHDFQNNFFIVTKN
jgi:2-polyprenyl-3-methyl-5-hydroxy-6-metoxy-1,4-benzoquinol methylase